MIPATDDVQRARIEAVSNIILNEVNVKQLQFAEGESLLVKKVKCNFRVMGKKYGKQMKAVAALVEALSTEEINKFEKEGAIELSLEGQPITIVDEDVSILAEDIPGWQVANEGLFTVALDIQIDEKGKISSVVKGI